MSYKKYNNLIHNRDYITISMEIYKLCDMLDKYDGISTESSAIETDINIATIIERFYILLKEYFASVMVELKFRISSVAKSLDKAQNIFKTTNNKPNKKNINHSLGLILLSRAGNNDLDKSLDEYYNSMIKSLESILSKSLPILENIFELYDHSLTYGTPPPTYDTEDYKLYIPKKLSDDGFMRLVILDKLTNLHNKEKYTDIDSEIDIYSISNNDIKYRYKFESDISKSDIYKSVLQQYIGLFTIDIHRHINNIDTSKVVCDDAFNITNRYISKIISLANSSGKFKHELDKIQTKFENRLKNIESGPRAKALAKQTKDLIKTSISICGMVCKTYESLLKDTNSIVESVVRLNTKIY